MRAASLLAVLAMTCCTPLPAFTHDARRAVVREVIDCDTIAVTVELGFGVLMDVSIRVLGVDAPETRGPEKGYGLACRERATRKWLSPGDLVTLTAIRRDKYAGRAVASVEMPDGRDLAVELLRGGWASAWDGTGPDPEYPPGSTYPIEVGP